VRDDLDDARVPFAVRVVHEQPPALHEVGRHGEAEEALLAPPRHARGEVEEGSVEEAPGLEHTDPAGLLDEEQAPRRVFRGERHRERLVELLGDLRERHLRRGLRRRRDDRKEEEGGR
jgi:hypothetical protein